MLPLWQFLQNSMGAAICNAYMTSYRVTKVETIFTTRDVRHPKRIASVGRDGAIF